MESAFFRDGLRFHCIRCSKCCRHEPGFVFLSLGDIKRLASALELDDNEFIRRYCRRVQLGGFSQLSLKEKENYDCIFWESEGCLVYEHRPLQCEAYPFWAKNLESPTAWEAEKRQCPGIGSGKLHTRKEIEAWLDARLKEPPV